MFCREKSFRHDYVCMQCKGLIRKSQTTIFDLPNPTMHLSHIPQCTIQNRNVHISVLNGVLWNMGQLHCGVCHIGLLCCNFSAQTTKSRHNTSRDDIAIIANNLLWQNIGCGTISPNTYVQNWGFIRVLLWLVTSRYSQFHCQTTRSYELLE